MSSSAPPVKILSAESPLKVAMKCPPSMQDASHELPEGRFDLQPNRAVYRCKPVLRDSSIASRSRRRATRNADEQRSPVARRRSAARIHARFEGEPGRARGSAAGGAPVPPVQAGLQP